MRVINADGSQVGILPTYEALKLAEEQNLELVEVSPRAVPPVCRIMDFGKFKYQESKKEKASRRHQSTVVVKEIKLRPKTDTHDLDFKLKHIHRFLGEGNKCKLVIVFRGREIVHPETGQAMLEQVVKACAEIAVVEQKPLMEGRRMVMLIGPRTGVIRSAVPVPAAPATAGTVVRPAADAGKPGEGPSGTSAPRPSSPPISSKPQ